MNVNVLRAVFVRNFVNYFASPTGYVFICVFVLLSSLAAFWPYEFFNSNLANLDQLNYWFPFIMLVFVPAITMSIWAEERRQGTDELLLTIPAGDFDIVLGKYLAAVAIYTISLIFSLVCNYTVLAYLGDPDMGLFCATYFGYWLIGLAMLAVGMVASFLTGNLTVSYVLGAVFNAPLVLATWAESAVRNWSIGGQFADFGRGILAFSGLAYFLTIAVVMLYLCMVLIGRRHWLRGRDWYALGLHYGLRAVALAVIAVGAIYFFHHHPLRADVTSEQLTRLSSYSIDLIDKVGKNLEEAEPKRTVQIEAFISPDVPEAYVQTRLNLLAKLDELEFLGGGLIQKKVYDTERFTPAATRAKTLYGIDYQQRFDEERGTRSEAYLYMGVAFTCGLERSIVPFLDRGVSAEYALVQALFAVTQQKRTRVGVVQGASSIPLCARFGQGQDQPIIEELKKQYEVEVVDPSSAIPERKKAAKDGEEEEGYDVLLVVQPSMLAQPQLENLLDAIRRGQPTAIFEDPFPLTFGPMNGTMIPLPPPRSQQEYQMRMMNNTLEKADIKPLWQLLGVKFSRDDGVEPDPSETDAKPTRADTTVWQNYDPFPKLPVSRYAREMLVYVGTGCGAKEPFNAKDAITSGLQMVMFISPTYLEKSGILNFEPLVRTGPNSGTIEPYVEMGGFSFMGGPQWTINMRAPKVPGPEEGYVLAARITGEPTAESRDEKDDETAAKKDDAKPKIDVVLVADIDLLNELIYRWTEQGEVEGLGMEFDCDNTAFVMNVVDALAGNEDFLALRTRRPKHRELTRITERTKEALKEKNEARDKAQKDFQDAIEKIQRKLEEDKAKLAKKLQQGNQGEGVDFEDFLKQAEKMMEAREKEIDDRTQELEDERDAEIERIEIGRDAEIRKVQDGYKWRAVVLPPILPLFLAIVVFITRRVREREGVSADRLR
ncbi:MAG TPA: Gldg family protein [Thermoguttaceae bacterium]|nr:Gldg family protein [Thermoguttaceae bacterium]